VSALIERAIEDASLGDVIAARRNGGLNEAQIERVRGSDLLVLGALADRVRSEEVGDEVRIFMEGAPDETDVVTLPPEGSQLTGLELLREIAVARVTGPRGVHVRVDWIRAGLELAQIALGFGADQLAGHLANKRGLPLADGEKLGVGKKSRHEDALVVKRRELEGFVKRAGRTPAFAEEGS
jgi:hypothetical protein